MRHQVTRTLRHSLLLFGLFAGPLAISGCQWEASRCQPCYEHSKTFLSRISQGQTQNAFDKLVEKSMLQEDVAFINRFSQSTSQILRQYGPVDGFEFIESEQKGRFETQIFYLYQKRSVTRWTFYYYQDPNENWVLANMDATDNYRLF